MLVLTRKKHESIQIADGIIITVQCISPSKVKLAVEAPREVTVRRGEIAKGQETQHDQ